MSELDSLLKRQLRRAGLDAGSLPTNLDAWQDFLQRISRSYKQGQQDRYLLERSLDLSSKEMQALYKDLERASETRVAAERDKLKALITAFTDGFCSLDNEGMVRFLNPVAETLLGNVESLAGQVILDRFDFHPKGDGDNSSAALLERLRNGETLRDEDATLELNDGRRIPVSAMIYPIFENGEHSGSALIFRDITERREAELELRRLAMSVRSSGDAIIITDTEARIVYTNPAFEHITGWSAEKALGRKTSILQSGRTPDRIYKELWQALENGETWSGRLLNRRIPRHPDDRELYWAQTTITPIYSDDHELLGYVGVQRDISDDVDREQRQATINEAANIRALVAQTLQGNAPLEQRLERVLEHLFEMEELRHIRKGGIFIQPDDSPHLEPTLFLGDFPDNFICSKRNLGFGECLCGRAAASGELLISDNSQTDTRHDRPAPADRPYGNYIVPLTHAGLTLGVMILYADTEPSYDPARLEMLRLVGETIGLAIADDRTRRESERARRAAEDAVEAKAKFLANMSHEIRTPMNGVLGMLEMVSQTNLDREQREYISTAHNSAESLLTVINDILDFSKIEAGKLELESIPFDLEQTTEDVATLLAARARSKKLELACFIDTGIPNRVIGDPTRLRQVLTNILGNAVKFTEAGEVVLRVELLQQSESTVQLRFEVRDTGIGIDREHIQRLFTPFTQADGSTTRRFGGTGLGLTISKQLVELMGGEIGVDSEPGRGSRFWFTVRLGRVDNEEMPRSRHHLEGIRVLAVDDNATNLTIIGHYLHSWGLEFDTASDGLQALEKLRNAQSNRHPFDLAILDMQMPGTDGLTLAKYIKVDPTLASTRLIILSSVGQPDENLRDIGIEAGLSKPVRQSILYNVIADVAGRNHKRAISTKPRPRDDTTLTGRVLLAEDNIVNQKVALGMLKKLGLHAEVAENGQIALEKLASGHYDLVLMDCQMPVLDGFEATREIRAGKGGHPCIPIVAMTANAMAGDREKCIAAGMDDYIAKPVKLDTLRKTLDNWLKPADKPTDSDTPPPDTIHQDGPGPALNRATIMQLREESGEQFEEILHAYLADTKRLLSSLRADLAGRDFNGLRMTARTLLRSSEHIGAPMMKELALRLGNIDPANAQNGEGLIERMEDEFSHIREVLHSFLRTDG
jgi:PAS domain S-box-containing protein